MEARTLLKIRKPLIAAGVGAATIYLLGSVDNPKPPDPSDRQNNEMAAQTLHTAAIELGALALDGVAGNYIANTSQWPAKLGNGKSGRWVKVVFPNQLTVQVEMGLGVDGKPQPLQVREVFLQKRRSDSLTHNDSAFHLSNETGSWTAEYVNDRHHLEQTYGNSPREDLANAVDIIQKIDNDIRLERPIPTVA